jgi:hypothetical protein
MTPDLSSIQLNARRAIEAELAHRIYSTALPRLGETAALEILNAAIDQAAFDTGRSFAAKAPGGVPSLEHFSAVLDLWQAGGALTIEDITLGPDSLSFCVVRCGYMEMYAQMGLPKVLHATLSCRRDVAFAEGYSPKLVLDRPEVISAGALACLFRFRWQD